MKLSRILYVVVFAGLFAGVNALADNVPQTQFNDAQVQAIQQIMHDYLVNQPQVLIDASQSLQKQEMAKAQKDSEAAIAANATQIFNSKGKPVAGNANGNIVMVEFFDYQCPHCQAMAATITQVIKANPNLKVIFAEFPIFGDNSKFAAKAAIASMQQGKYLAFHNALLKASAPLTRRKVLQIAKATGLNIVKLQQDMKSKTIDTQIKANFDLAGKIKIMGTPAFAIGNLQNQKISYVPGQANQQDLQAAIDKVK